MGDFSKMSQSDIELMSDDDFKKVSPFEKKSCFDCSHLKSAMSWWCTNKDAIKARGTSIPGCIKCTFWSPDWDMINHKYKTKENGFIEKKEPLTEVKKSPTKWYQIFKKCVKS